MGITPLPEEHPNLKLAIPRPGRRHGLRGQTLVRPSNVLERSSSIRRSPATRKFSRTILFRPDRHPDESQIGNDGHQQRTAKPPGHIEGLVSASSPLLPATGARPGSRGFLRQRRHSGWCPISITRRSFVISAPAVSCVAFFQAVSGRAEAR